MKRRIYNLVVMFGIVLTGCATVSAPLPTIQTQRGDRIGVYVDIGDSPTHTHIGTTAFHNFEQTYPFHWDLEARVTEALADALTHAGFQVVDLKAEGVTFLGTTRLVVSDGHEWRLATGKENRLRRFRDQLHLRGLIALKEDVVLAALECMGGPCSERYVDHPGLYTRSVLDYTRYYAVAAFKWNLVILDPPADLATAEPFESTLRSPAVPLFTYPEPDDFYNLTEAEFVPVRDAIVAFAEQVADDYVWVLNPR